MRESKVEQELRKHVKDRGGLYKKFVSPGWAGAPDRILMPGRGQVYFVELKAPGKKLRPLQEKRGKELRAMGMDVRTIDSIDGVIEFVKEVYGG